MQCSNFHCLINQIFNFNFQFIYIIVPWQTVNMSLKAISVNKFTLHLPPLQLIC